jgi:hypothetical protein
MVQNNKVNFTAYRGLNLIKTWTIKELVNGALVNYNMTGKTIVLRVYNRDSVPVLLYELASTSVGNGLITFTFNASQTDQPDLVDYLMVEDPAGVSLVIQNGTASFMPIGYLVPFSELVLNETPGGLVIPENFVTIKAYEWRLFLQNAIYPNISDANLNNEAAWPVLVNYLIAKLVVYDYILKSIKGLIARNDSTDEANSAGVKKIETGPSNAEFFDTVKSMADFLRMDKNGRNSLNALAIDICQLASRVKVYLPICNNPDQGITLPDKAGRIPMENPTTFLLKHFS